MKPFLKITFATFTMWLLASFINGLLGGIYRSITRQYPDELAGDTLFIFFGSLFFSAPGFFILWVILLKKLAGKICGRALFRAALSAGFILATATAIICLQLFKPLFPSNRYMIMLFVILSATTSSMLHFNYFNKINNQAR